MEHTCPIQQVQIKTKCPVSSCMWNSPMVKTGCIHGNVLVDSDEFLVRVKGLNAETDLSHEVDRATHNIECLVVLDSYCNHLEDRSAKVPLERIEHLRRLIYDYPQFSRGNGWSVEKLYLALSFKEWNKFKRTLSKEVLHREVLGLQRKDYKAIQSLIYPKKETK